MTDAIPVSSRCTGCEFYERKDVVVNEGHAAGHYHQSCCRARTPHFEAESDCARDEIVLWVAQHYAGDRQDEAVAWLLAWANRRHAQVQARLVDTLREIGKAQTYMDKQRSRGDGSEYRCELVEKMWEHDEVTIETLRLAAYNALRFAGHEK